MNNSYLNPEVDADSYGSPMDQAIRENNQNQKADADNYYSVMGNPMKGGGRTLNIPKNPISNKIPDASFNGAVTSGAPCVGAHCSIPVKPSVNNMIHNNLSNGNNIPPYANVNYPGNYRLGNNWYKMTGIDNYIGSEMNPGPFQMDTIQSGGGLYKYIYHPITQKKYNIYSVKGKRILKKYLYNLNI